MNPSKPIFSCAPYVSYKWHLFLYTVFAKWLLMETPCGTKWLFILRAGLVFKISAKAQVVAHWPLTAEVRVQTRVFPCRCAVHEVSLGQVALQILRYFHVRITPSMFCTHLIRYYSYQMEKWVKSGNLQKNMLFGMVGSTKQISTFTLFLSTKVQVLLIIKYDQIW